MKKLPKVGTVVVLKKSSELVNDVAAYFNNPAVSKTHRTFRVVNSVKRLSNQLTVQSVHYSDLVLILVDITEVKKL